MKKKLVILSLIATSLASVLALPLSADGPDNKTLGATITPLVISLTITPNTVTYGTRAPNVGTIASNPAMVTIANTGSVAENFQVKGGDSLSGDWKLGSSIGQDQFVHTVSPGSGETMLTTSYQNFATNIGPTENVNLFPTLTIPSTITKTAPQTLPIFVLAIQKP